jgi:heavy metal efflux system protein
LRRNNESLSVTHSPCNRSNNFTGPELDPATIVVRELGQPSLIIGADRRKIARYGINVADVEAVVQAAIGGQSGTQVIQGEKLFDLVVRMEPQFRSGARQIGDLLVPAPAGQQIPLSELATIKESTGASFIYRENNSRYIGIQFSVEGRDLESVVKSGREAVRKSLALPQGYSLDWGGECSELLKTRSQFHHCPARRPAHFPHSLRALRQL